jgi:hypothetical protein
MNDKREKIMRNGYENKNVNGRPLMPSKTRIPKNLEYVPAKQVYEEYIKTIPDSVVVHKIVFDFLCWVGMESEPPYFFAREVPEQ